MENPYMTSGINPVSQESSSQITPGVLQALAGTKPWVRFCSIIGLIGTGFMFLAAVAMILVGFFAPASSSGGAKGLDALGMGGGLGLGAVYIVLGILYLFPSIKLWKYGSHIASLLQSNSSADLESALEAQRSFWKFVSIMMIIGIVLYIVGIAAVVIFSVSSASSAIPSP